MTFFEVLAVVDTLLSLFAASVAGYFAFRFWWLGQVEVEVHVEGQDGKPKTFRIDRSAMTRSEIRGVAGMATGIDRFDFIEPSPEQFPHEVQRIRHSRQKKLVLRIRVKDSKEPNQQQK